MPKKTGTALSFSFSFAGIFSSPLPSLYCNIFWFTSWPHIQAGQEEVKGRGRPPQIGKWQFNKQGKFCTRLSWVGSKTSRSLHLPARILKVSIEALTGLSHVYCTDGLNNTLLSQSYVLEHGSRRENCENIHPRTGKG